MRLMPAKMALAIVFLILCGFRFSLVFGELSWEKIDAALREDFPGVRNMEIEELQRRMAQGDKLHLVDARSREEFLVSHIPGAVLVEDFDVGSRLEDIPIVAYCSVGLRSAKYVRSLQEEGVQEVFNLRGSIFMWANKGFELYSSQGGPLEVHPYNSRWGKLLDQRFHPR